MEKGTRERKVTQTIKYGEKLNNLRSHYGGGRGRGRGVGETYRTVLIRLIDLGRDRYFLFNNDKQEATSYRAN